MVVELAQAQARTEQRLEQLVLAQVKTEEALHLLADKAASSLPSPVPKNRRGGWGSGVRLSTKFETRENPMHTTRRRSAGYVLAAMLMVFATLFVVACGTSPAPTPSGTPPSSWYQLYFTTPKFPDDPKDHHGSLDEKLSKFLATAQASIDMAIYQLDLPDVTQALLDAKNKRGVAVRIVTDVDVLEDPKENPSFQELEKAGIPIVAGNRSAIMHDKFVVVDRERVWTGSWNFTTFDTYRYNNNGLIIPSKDLAKNYTTTFEKMFNDKQFGSRRKPGGITHKLTIAGVTAENYFAPEDNVEAAIIARLSQAEKSIYFMAFSFTDDEIGAAVRQRAQAGVKVRGVFETTGAGTEYSEYEKMKEAGLDVVRDGNPYFMHHKVFIVDEKTVVFGSFNFSKKAAEDNDENLVIVDDAGMAAQFVQEFERVYAQAKNPPK